MVSGFGVHVRSLRKEAVFFFCTLSTYVQFMAFATRAVHVTPGRARLCCSLLYGSLVLCYLALPFIDGTHMDGNVINVQLQLGF